MRIKILCTQIEKCPVKMCLAYLSLAKEMRHNQIVKCTSDWKMKTNKKMAQRRILWLSVKPR